MRRIVISAVLLLTACATPTATTPPAATPSTTINAGHSILNASLWVQSSAEYRANALQTYAGATRMLADALADRNRAEAVEGAKSDVTQPPAVILDLDETVLDNTGFEARVIQAGKTYDRDMWKQWTSEGIAAAIPGAREFIDYAHSHGVRVFYISNRDEDERTGTTRNLRNLGFPLEEGALLLRVNGVSDKSPRRQDVANRFRVLLVIGDDLNDFVNAREASWQERDDIIRARRAWWGTHWFMLPNPMYGSWEDAAIGKGGTPEERVEKKVRAMKP
jgi:5'-nucleotidase (lipoprotein e(P4) family)